jgi:NADPH2:quinone reductase
VLVKADTIGVSRPELLVRRGVYPWMPPLPAIPGIEMAGTVAGLGAGAGRFKTGDKVYVTARELPVRAGCYAEYIAVPSARCFRCRRRRTSEAAACLSNYQVAWHLLHTATRRRRGQAVLIGSGLGRPRQRRGATSEARGDQGDRAGRLPPKRRGPLVAYGADHAIDTKSEDIAAFVAAITHNKGVDVVLDAATGKDFAQVPADARAVRPRRFLRKNSSAPWNQTSSTRSTRARAICTAPRCALHPCIRSTTNPPLRAQSMNDLISKLAAGSIRPLIPRPPAAEDARRAHRDDRGARGDRQDFAEAVNSSFACRHSRSKNGDPLAPYDPGHHALL